MTAPAGVVDFAPRRETCACGEVDDRFLHAREMCFLLDDEVDQ